MSIDRLPAVRSFFRVLTLRVGVFTDSFLDRGRPLAHARLLFEIGKEGADVRDLRARMNLDSGYLSRMLRALEKDGLIEIKALPSDLRAHRASLTEAGLRELQELNRLGDSFVEDTLEPLNEAQRERLVLAMSEVEKLLNLSSARISLEDPQSPDAKWCLDNFLTELDKRFEDGFDVARSIAVDSEGLRPPQGAFLIARLDGRPVGCGAVTITQPGVGSIKRMWMSPDVRGAGLGLRLLDALEKEAAGLGIELLRLETNKTLHEAQSLYRRSGYREVPAFNDEPYAHHWFEKGIEPR
jgi:DNA-binding MarR family transcriptional regulator/GNAT superfamily N-acetyltransferase